MLGHEELSKFIIIICIGDDTAPEASEEKCITDVMCSCFLPLVINLAAVF